MRGRPNQKKLRRLRRLKVPHRVVGNLIVVEGDPRQRILQRDEPTETAQTPDTIRRREPRLTALPWVRHFKRT